MTAQLRAQELTDGRLKYNADGKIVAENGIEILVSEVSSAFAENDRDKTSFDHYKAMFGLLTILRTTAVKYQYASFATFSQLKIHFVHTHNRAMRHWTMFTPEDGLYIMNKEQKVHLFNIFEEKQEKTVPLLNFTITLGVSLKETLKVFEKLSKEHQAVVKEVQFNPSLKHESLTSRIKPMIVRLNEGKHSNEVSSDGPMSPLYIPGA